MEKDNIKIAVLLTVHNRKDITIKCLEKLYNTIKPSNIELCTYLVDDGCTDGTSDAVSCSFPQVNIIKGDGSLYWNRGMWTAWNEAAKKKYDYYLWLNDDTTLYPTALTSLLDCSKQQDDKTIIVGATENAKHTSVTYGGRINGKVPTPQGHPVEVDFFNGNVVLVPSYVYDIVGNLDPYFNHSKGDFDYGLRAKKMGIKTFQVGIILGECDNHPSVDKWCNPDFPLKERWNAMYKPNGMPPKEFFYYDRRHSGLYSAILHYLTIHLRCLYPSLWIKK